MFDFQKMMKQAQNVQEKMQTLQEELSHVSVTGESGGVKITVNCKYEYQKVEIPAEACSDPDLVSDMVLMALQDCNTKIQAITEERMSEITAGLNIPGLKLPGF